MHANDTNNHANLIHPELSYLITGICFEVHNVLGRFAREKQYGDLLEKKFKDLKISYKREFDNGDRNIVDFIVEDKVILELKAKKFILKDDYYQIQRYLQFLDIKLGFIINFRNQYLKPLRIVRIDTANKNKFA